MNDHIGPERAVAGLGRLLFEKIAPVLHAGQLHHPPQGDFPPSAPDMGLPEGRDQLAGFPLQLVLGLIQGCDLLGQFAIGFLAGHFHGPDVQVIFFKGFGYRPDHFPDGLFTIFQSVFRGCHVPGKGLAGQIQK
jgi:hypothetical protein